MSSSKLAARSSSLLLRHTRLQKTYQKRPSSDSRISPLQRLLISDPYSLHDAQHPIDLLDDHVEYDEDEDDDGDDDDFVDDDDDPEDDADDDDAVGDDAVDEDYDAIDDADDDGHHGIGVLQPNGKSMESPSVIMTHFQDAVPLDQDNVALPFEDINGANTNIILNNSVPPSSSPVPAVPAPAIITAVGYHTAGSENSNNNNVNGQLQTPVAPPLIPKAKSKDKDVAPPSLSSVNTKLSSKPGLTKKGRSKPQHHHHSYQTYVSSIAKSRPLLNDDLADMFSQLYLEQLPHPTRIRNLTDIGTGSTQQKNLAFLLRINK